MSDLHLTKSVDETQTLAGKIAKNSVVGTVIALVGNLGTGKTAFSACGS